MLFVVIIRSNWIIFFFNFSQESFFRNKLFSKQVSFETSFHSTQFSLIELKSTIVRELYFSTTAAHRFSTHFFLSFFFYNELFFLVSKRNSAIAIHFRKFKNIAYCFKIIKFKTTSIHIIFFFVFKLNFFSLNKLFKFLSKKIIIIHNDRISRKKLRQNFSFFFINFAEAFRNLFDLINTLNIIK